MASLRPPDRPRMEGISTEGLMPEIVGPLNPPNNGQPSSLAMRLTRLIADKGNFTANGELILNQMTVELIQILIRSEQDCAEANRRRDEQTQAIANQMQVMTEQISNLVQLQHTPPKMNVPPMLPRVPKQPTYEERTKLNLPVNARKPTTQPPTKDGMRLYRPGRAVIHSNPLKNQINKIPKALFLQRANKSLSRMNARVQDELVTVTRAHVMNSGDVVFYTKNKFHQKWLMDNKHLWSKEVHPDLEATPSAWSVLAHGVPKDFDPTSDFSNSKLATANGFNKEELIRMRWLSDNMNTAKKAGSIVLSFASKELADRIAYTGIFLDYDYHRVTAFKPYPAQCFKCLKMGHFGKWCQDPPQCRQCDGSHTTKECPDCPEGSMEITKCVKCKEGARNKVKGINDIKHSVFSVLCPYKRTWLQAKKSCSMPLSC